jgi:hypothetical protein
MTKRPGRPTLDPDDPSVRFSLTLPSKRYDALCRHAAAERETVADVLRRALSREFRVRKVPPRPPSD